MIDAYFVGYSRSASTSIELAFHAHPQIQQSMKMRLFVRDTIYPQKIDAGLQLYDNNGRIKIESDEEFIGNDLMGDYRTILDRVRKHNPKLKIIVSLRCQKTRIPSEYINELISTEGFLTFKNWLRSLRGYVLMNSSHYFERLQNLYNMFGQENVHVILFEKFATDPLQELNRLFKFLGVDSIGPESSPVSKNNYAPSSISIFMLSCFNKFIYSLSCLKNIKSPISFPFYHPDAPLDISMLRNCLDNKDVILKSDHRYRKHVRAMKYLYLPYLQKIDKYLNRFCKKLHLDYISSRDREAIAKFYYDNNRKLEELLGMDLSQYGY